MCVRAVRGVRKKETFVRAVVVTVSDTSLRYCYYVCNTG